jgi:hypothetical protein
MIAGLLSDAGIYCGDDANLRPPDEHNQRGYFEHGDIMRLNHEILQEVGIYFWDLVRIKWKGPKGKKVFAFEGEVKKMLKIFDEKDVFTIKDPKISKLLPLWKKCLKDEGISVKFVVIFRDPPSVARSLLKFKPKMKHWPIKEMWKSYYEDILKYVVRGDSLFLEYDRFLDRPDFYIKQLFKFVDCRIWDKKRLLNFVSRDLRHNSGIKKNNNKTYRKLLKLIK